MDEHGTYRVPGQTEVRREARLPFASPIYSEPTPEEVRHVLRLADLTGASAGTLLGVTGRTIRKWTGGDQGVPYSAWRLLLTHVGMALDLQRTRFVLTGKPRGGKSGIAHALEVLSSWAAQLPGRGFDELQLREYSDDSTGAELAWANDDAMALADFRLACKDASVKCAPPALDELSHHK